MQIKKIKTQISYSHLGKINSGLKNDNFAQGGLKEERRQPELFLVLTTK
jgi:hypothetical protein